MRCALVSWTAALVTVVMRHAMSERTTETLRKDMLDEDSAGSRAVKASGCREATTLYQRVPKSDIIIVQENSGVKIPSITCRCVGRGHVG